MLLVFDKSNVTNILKSRYLEYSIIKVLLENSICRYNK